MKSKKLVLWIIIFLLLSPFEAFANSAEPPSIVILVHDAPSDLEVVFIIGKDEILAEKYEKFGEVYFSLYEGNISNLGPCKLRVISSEKTYVLDIAGSMTQYSMTYRLNFEDEQLRLGKGFLRSIILISVRVFMTLVIEGIIFYLFRFNKLRSWKIFIIINLMTQGLLNIWINTAHPFEGYIILYLIFAELFILIFEMIGFMMLVKEKKQWITCIYVVTANIVSLVLGAILIPMLPI